MKVYTFWALSIFEGIDVIDCKDGPRSYKAVVVSGLNSRSPKSHPKGLKVRFGESNPPETKDGRIFRAHPVRFSASRGDPPRWHLVRPRNENDDRVLVMVRTAGHPDRRPLQNLEGASKVLCSGSSKDGGWRADGALVVMHSGDVLVIDPGHDGHGLGPLQVLGYSIDQGLWTMPLDEYERLSAMFDGMFEQKS